MTVRAVIGIVAGILALVASPIYVHDILAGTTRPNRATWWILALSGGLLAASYYASGARDTVWVAGSCAIGYLAIAVVSLWYGEGRLSKLDIACLITAAGSAVAWWLWKTPQVTLYATIGIDCIGIVPTIWKAYRRPESESAATWLVDMAAGILNLCALDSCTPSESAYPVYLAITNSLIAYFVLRPIVLRAWIAARESWIR